MADKPIRESRQSGEMQPDDHTCYGITSQRIPRKTYPAHLLALAGPAPVRKWLEFDKVLGNYLIGDCGLLPVENFFD
jgi:hypothetical protein